MKSKVMVGSIVIAIALVIAIAIPTAFADDKLDKIDKDLARVLEKVSRTDIMIDIYGTEYSPGSPGTIWLQLLRNFQPINNSTCYIDAYYPNKTKLINFQLMFYLPSSDGIYYHDLTVPSTVGVYMLSATCFLPGHTFADDFINFDFIQFSENVTITNGKLVLLNSTSGAGNITGRSGAVFGLDKAGGVYSYKEGGTLEWSDTGFKSEDLEAVDYDEDGFFDDVIAGSDAPEILVYNETGDIVCSYVPGGAVKTVAGADFDKDLNNNEPIAGTKELDDMIYAINESCDLLWNYSAGDDVNDVQAIDLDGDGYMNEVVAGTNGNEVIALWSNGTLAWMFTNTNNFKYLSIADINHDGIFDDTFAGNDDDSIYLINNSGGVICSYATGGNIKTIATVDQDNDGFMDEVCVPSDDDNLYMINESCDVVWSFTSPTADGMKTCASADFDGDGNFSDVFFGGDGGVLYAYYGNGTQRWSLSLGSKIKERTIATADFHGSQVLDDAFVGAEKTAYAINFNGTVRWTDTLLQNAKATASVSFFIKEFNYSQGFIQSVPIVLNSTSWNIFGSSYVNNSGDTYFEVRDSANNTICSGLGGVSSCAGSTSPIELWVNITRPDASGTSPQLDSWFISSANISIEEIKGAGEMHVSNATSAQDIYEYFWLLGDPHENLISNHDTCLDDSTLLKEITTEKCLNSVCTTFTENRTIDCQYGCVEDQCRPSPVTTAMVLVGILLLMMIVFGAIWWIRGRPDTGGFQ